MRKDQRMERRSSIPSRREVSVEEKVAFLRQPDAYPERPSQVEVVETHMSWVFLTDDCAYKLKKPLRTAFFDFRTLRARRYNCLEEIRLNRQLAPGIYLGVVPLLLDRAGALQLGLGERAFRGTAVEWLVRMRRLPAGRTLEHAIRSGTVTEGDIEWIAQVLTDFYRHARPLALDPVRHRRSFDRLIESMAASLRRSAYSLPESLIDGVALAGLRFAARQGPLLEARARDGHVIEAHGDLRPEHIYLMPGPVIVDRLEFSFALRALDPVDELAYLALECDRLGASWIGLVLFDRYQAATADHPEPELFDFYKTVRALVRAKLAAGHIDDPATGAPAAWRQRALDYLEAAGPSVRRLTRESD